jgi:hypothetical protein
MKQFLIFIGAGVVCAFVWYLADRFIFDDANNLKYYTAVVFAYVTGALVHGGLKK